MTHNHPILDPSRTCIVEATQDDGFIVSRFIQWDDDSWHVERQVYEPKITVEKDLENVTSMLWGVLDALEVYTGKHGPQTIDIEVVDQN